MATLIMTLEEMLKVALGTTTPDRINLSVLHSFLKIIVQKLDLSSLFVEISGPEVCELRQMLCHAQNPLTDFKTCDEGKSNFSSPKVVAMEARIDDLMEAVHRMEADLRAHLDATKKCIQPPPICEIQLLNKRKIASAQLSSEDEDLCNPCDADNLIACSLLRNKEFLKKLMRAVSSPVVDRIFEFEKMIQILNEKFQNFLNLADDEYKKIPLIEDCLIKIAALEEQLNRHTVEFLQTMEEIQEMLDAKMNKIHIPPLKKYIIDRLDEVQQKLDDLQKKEECPKAAGVIMHNLQCLCCTSRVCQKDGVFPVPLMATAPTVDKIKHSKGNFPKLCIPPSRDRACGGRHTVIRPGERSLQTSNLIDDFGDKNSLRIGHENVEFVKGADGGMYRLAADANIPCKEQL